MSNSFHIYEFEEFTLDEEIQELRKSREIISLEPKPFQLLLLLVKNQGKPISRQEILNQVWGEDVNILEGGIDVRLNRIRTVLGETDERKFIEAKNKRIRFLMPVTWQIKTSRRLEENKSATAQTVIQKSETDYFFVETGYSFRQWLVLGASMLGAFGLFYLALMFFTFGGSQPGYQSEYIYLNSFFYGLLAPITLILETAYDFRKYRKWIFRMAPVVFLSNASAIASALTCAALFLPENVAGAFFSGLAFLAFGTALTCLAGSAVLPNVPITVSNEEKTQPALLAFLKNVGFYYFLIYLFFGLFIFCLSYGTNESYRNRVLALIFLLIWGFLTLLSWISINLFNGSLKTLEDGGKYKNHGLFVSMSYLRLFFCFLPTLFNLGIYFFSIP